MKLIIKASESCSKLFTKFSPKIPLKKLHSQTPQYTSKTQNKSQPKPTLFTDLPHFLQLP